MGGIEPTAVGKAEAICGAESEVTVTGEGCP